MPFSQNIMIKFGIIQILMNSLFFHIWLVIMDSPQQPLRQIGPFINFFFNCQGIHVIKMIKIRNFKYFLAQLYEWVIYYETLPRNKPSFYINVLW